MSKDVREFLIALSVCLALACVNFYLGYTAYPKDHPPVEANGVSRDDFCAVVQALHDVDLDRGIEVTKDMQNVDGCF